jgi:hypothetical protein
MNDILDYFNIPQNCKATKKLKTYLLEQAPLKSTEKKILKESTKSIILQYILNQSKINITKYEDEDKRYIEVYVMVIEVFNTQKIKQISSIIQSIFQKPIILIFQQDTNISINITPKRINKSDTSKLVVEDTFFTDWINLADKSEIENGFLESLNIQNQPYTDFLSFYTSYLDKIISFNTSKYSGNLDTNEKAKEILQEIQKIETQILELKNKIKKETNFNDKVNLNIELKKLNDKLKNLKHSL